MGLLFTSAELRNRGPVRGQSYLLRSVLQQLLWRFCLWLIGAFPMPQVQLDGCCKTRMEPVRQLELAVP